MSLALRADPGNVTTFPAYPELNVGYLNVISHNNCAQMGRLFSTISGSLCIWQPNPVGLVLTADIYLLPERDCFQTLSDLYINQSYTRSDHFNRWPACVRELSICHIAKVELKSVYIFQLRWLAVCTRRKRSMPHHTTYPEPWECNIPLFAMILIPTSKITELHVTYAI